MNPKRKKRWHNVTIEEIVDERISQRYDAPAFIESLKGQIPLEEWRLRNELAKASLWLDSNHLLTCFLCGQPVRLRGKVFGKGTREGKTLHFTHAKKNVNCPYHDGKVLSQIELNRMRFHGQREGPRHKLLKKYLEHCLILEQDKYGKVADIRVEKVIRLDKTTWRKPDLNFSFSGKDVAIDLQLSTTYLDVILERQRFYRSIGTYMLWIFDSFELDHIDRVYAKTDVLINNNENAYVFDHEEYHGSIKNEKFSLYCYYLVYRYDGGLDEIKADWNHARITLDEITFDEERGCLYYFDSEKSRKAAIESQKREKERQKRRRAKKMQLAHTIDQLAFQANNFEDQTAGYKREILDNERTILELLEKYRAKQSRFNQYFNEPENASANNAVRAVRLVELLRPEYDREREMKGKHAQYDQKIKQIESSLTQLLELRKYFEKVSAPIKANGVELVCVSNSFPETVYFTNLDILWTKHKFCPTATKYGDDINALKYDLKNPEGNSFIYMERQCAIDILNEIMKSQAAQVNELDGQKRQSSEEFLQYVADKHNEELNRLRQEIARFGNKRREAKRKRKQAEVFLSISKNNLSKAQSEIAKFSDIRD